MTDERNIAHDKKIADEKRERGDTGSNDAVQPQPGRKPPQVDSDTDPSNSRAREMYKDGDAPRDHSHESSEHPVVESDDESDNSDVD
ncbi:MAG: hypothetical protein JWL98_1746 [Xanthomonadaceae bacterium]|nr:hypothetical protein [Xanthomonadaceae bacterium]